MYAEGDNGETLIAEHTDIKDKDQYIYFPGIGTTAFGKNTAEHITSANGIIEITDAVAYNNLISGLTYIMEGTIYDKTTAKPLLDKNGKEVTATKEFTTKKLEDENGKNLPVSGTVLVNFEFEADNMAGKDVVVYERCYEHKHNETYAEHKDLTDEGQTVHIPDIATTASDTNTKDHVGKVGETPADGSVSESVKYTTIKDSVFYENLIPGHTYKVSGTLHNKATGDVLRDSGGNEITTEREFEAPFSSGFIDIFFDVDSSLLEGTTVVAFESMKFNEAEIATHADIEDEAQSVHFPKIRTMAKDGTNETKFVTVNENEVSIVDTVSYDNLIPGETYTVTGILMDKDTSQPYITDGIPANSDSTAIVDFDNETTTIINPVETTEGGGEQVISQQEFVAPFASGTVDVTFRFKTGDVYGKKLVVFEKLIHNEIEVTRHEDINDEDQSMYAPKIGTVARDSVTTTHDAIVSDNSTFIDNVMYENLIPGIEYTIKGTLYNKETGEPIMQGDEPITGSTDFIPESSSGSVDVIFENIDTDAIAGTVTVMFEDLYVKTTETVKEGDTTTEKETEKQIAIHEDLNNEDQSIYIPEIGTEAEDDITGGHNGAAVENNSLTDHISYKGLIPGQEYTIKGTLYDKATGKPVTNDDGDTIVAETTFTPTASSGEVDIVFDDINGKFLAGKTVVAFEKLYHLNTEIAAHEDIDDDDQSVTYPKMHTTATVGGKKTSAADKSVTINDVVTYKNLSSGETYTLKGVLYDKTTKKAVKISDKQVTGSKTWTAVKADSNKTVKFKFDATGYEGHTFVVYEYLYQGDDLIATHEDITDKDQSIKFTKETPSAPVSQKSTPDNYKPSGKSKKTGDPFPIIPVAVGLLLIAGGMGIVIKKQRKRTGNRKKWLKTYK